MGTNQDYQKYKTIKSLTLDRRSSGTFSSNAKATKIHYTSSSKHKEYRPQYTIACYIQPSLTRYDARQSQASLSPIFSISPSSLSSLIILMTVTSLQITSMPLICGIKKQCHGRCDFTQSPWKIFVIAHRVFSFRPTLGLVLALINMRDRPLIAHQSAGSDSAVFWRFTPVKSPTLISSALADLKNTRIKSTCCETVWTSFTAKSVTTTGTW